MKKIRIVCCAIMCVLTKNNLWLVVLAYLPLPHRLRTRSVVAVTAVGAKFDCISRGSVATRYRHGGISDDRFVKTCVSKMYRRFAPH